MFLPIIQSKVKSDQEIQSGNVVVGNEKILFVDDEKPIVKFAVRVLERIGYSVTGTTSSKEALEVFKSNPNKFDIVITDMAMPHMVGTELAKKILELRPNIPIIICTGFSDQVDMEAAKAIGIKDYANKPILTSDFAIKIRNLLDQTT
ncbi:response regulator [Desulfobacter hydrogenophilus]|uniref:response regulator n=1 Tax=Desulfobacter hydrogenophilus TaxID=2291 RepID=UPI003BF81194